MKTKAFLLTALLFCFASHLQAAPTLSQYEKFYEKGQDFHKKKDYLRAIEWYQASVNVNKENPEALRALGLAYLEYAQSLLKRATRSLEEALILDPNHEQALEEMGRVLITQGQLVEAKDLLNKLQRLRSLHSIGLKETLDTYTQSAILVTQQ